MGYELHVTRARDWSASSENPITLEEWLAYVAGDPEMRLDGFAEAVSPSGETIRIESPGLCVWTAWSHHGVEGGMAWFDHSNGRIAVKNPDGEIIRKLHEIAVFFGARVQGDDGEEYDAGGRRSEPAEAPTIRRPWWKRVFRREGS